MNIQEDYVSFETAKLLKENGFGGECFSMYVTPKPHSGMGNPNEAKIAPHGRDSHYYEGYEYQCEAPTIQMAMKWLRKKHNIHIEPRYFPIPNIYRYVIIHSPFTIENIDSHPQYFNTYEEAVEMALKYCLENLI